ncbi:MAG: tetratricopeptide repeat protein [Bacteroidales bacterium]|nr:tetratricopeptide repeat protein [Candidatus Liminaster caballi]
MKTQEQTYLRQGREAWQRQDWQMALDCYQHAIELNPESEAVELRRMAVRIIEFHNKEIYNV